LFSAGTFFATGSSVSKRQDDLDVMAELWTEQNAVATTNLVKAFEKLNPNISIKIGAHNRDELLQICCRLRQSSGTGPDLAVMWTGVYDLKYANDLVNLKGNVPAADLAKMEGLQWEAPNFNASKGAYVMAAGDPVLHRLLQQALFKKAGITSVPTDWSQLLADCKRSRRRASSHRLRQPVARRSSGKSSYPGYDMVLNRLATVAVDDGLRMPSP